MRIAYFEQEKAPLMLGPVTKAVAFLRDQPGVEAIMLNAHWKFGPHVDLNVRCDPVLFEPLFVECERMIMAWLTEHPSTVTLNPEQYEDLSTKLAVSELESPPFTPLLDNNSVSRPKYQLSRAIDLAQIAESKEDFLSSSVNVVLTLIALMREDTDEVFITLILMMAAIARHFNPDGIKRGYVSYRSHAEYFFDNFDKTGKMREKMDAIDKRYAQRIDANLKPIVAQDFAALDLSKAAVAVLEDWAEVVQQSMDHNRRVVQENHEALIGDTDTTSTEDNFLNLAREITAQVPKQYHPDPEQVAPGSVVDAAMQHQEGRDLFRSADFIAYRTTVNFFYMLLPLMDISPTKKFMLCHLAANSVERVYAISWRDWIPDAGSGVTAS